MLQINKINFSYGKGINVLDDFSLDISESGVYGLLGKNGTGKSTLLYLIMGLLRPQTGEITFNGIDTRLRRPEVLQDMFIVPEEYDLPAIKLSKYVSSLKPFYPRFNEDLLKECLEAFDMPYDVNLGSLSMGQKKKVYMCVALATNTRLLLMDEPTNGLDIPSKSHFRKVVSMGMGEDRVVIISTHQVRDVEHLLDHVCVIDNRCTLLNASMRKVEENLCFLNVERSGIPDNAIYTEPSLGGFNVVAPAADGCETPVNLEMLFNALISKGDEIRAAIENK